MRSFTRLLICATAATACDPSTFLHGVGTHASKYKTAPAATSASSCCAACRSDAACGSFVWTGAKLQKCHLKRGTVEQAGLVNTSETAAFTCGDSGRAPAPGPSPAPTPPVPPPLGFKPPIIFFLADDLGRYNMGWRGNKEARTPALDALVADGVVLDRHYVYQYCSPTRSAFLSGRLPIHINMKNMGPMALGGVDIRASTVADRLRGAGASRRTG